MAWLSFTFFYASSSFRILFAENPMSTLAHVHVVHRFLWSVKSIEWKFLALDTMSGLMVSRMLFIILTNSLCKKEILAAYVWKLTTSGCNGTGSSARRTTSLDTCHRTIELAATALTDCHLHYPASAKFTYKINRDGTKFEIEFDNVRTSNVFHRFEICRMF